MEIANVIDHTFLSPDCTLADIKKLCQEASDHQLKAVCVPPYYVKEASNFLKDSDVMVATVIGFPMGYAATPAKVEEIKRAIDEGADELDAVVNICAVKSQNWNYVKNDIDSITRIAHLKGKVLKLIIETGMLEANEIEKLCEICTEVGVDFVKTSTGFNAAGANVEIVSKLRSLLPPSVKIKASGGIRSYQTAKELLEAGANRIGSSASLLIVEGQPE
jgi:deoxyribose-phosphate aldolase